MPSTVLLAKVLGLFMVIVGLAMLLQRREMAEISRRYAEDVPLRVFISAIELLAGLFLVALHNDWSGVPAGIVSLVGWMAVLEGTLYLALPTRVLKPWLMSFASPGILAVSGALAVLLGLYLAAWGFSAG